MNRLKINITGIRGIPANHGGFETFAESLSTYMLTQNCIVTVYCQILGWNGIYQDDWKGVNRINIAIPFSGPLSTIIFDLLSVLHVCFFSRSLTLVLGYNTAVFSVFYRLFRITTIMNMDGIEWHRSKWGTAARGWLKINEWLGCQFSNYLIADHDEIKNHLLTRHGSLPISTIPYGANAIAESPVSHLQAYNLHPQEYYLVIARPEPENLIAEIVTGFVESGSNKKLILLGNYNQSINYQANVIKISDERVIFLGAIYNHSVVSALRYHCFAYIHGHTVGGTNPSLVEAMGAGCPIIAHNNCFNRGVCENSALYFHDSIELKKIIDNTTDESISRLKTYSYARFKDSYTLESVNTKYMELFYKISKKY